MQAPDKAAALITAWDDALEPIPTEWLDRAFKRAMQAARTNYPVAHGDVLAAWDTLLVERQQAAAQTDPARLLDGPAPSYQVQDMLPILKAFCQDVVDPVGFPTRLAYALLCVKAGYVPNDLRRLLAATQQPTLYHALLDLEVPGLFLPPKSKYGRGGLWAGFNAILDGEIV